MNILLLTCALALRINKYHVNSKYIQRQHDVRVYKGVPDTENKHPYVVAVIGRWTVCTGTAIAPQWVLTAGHCIFPYERQYYIHYGNITYAWKLNARAKVLSTILHPFFRNDLPGLDGNHLKTRPGLAYDLALMYTQVFSLTRFATLLAVDYKALVGLTVEYGGYGRTELYERTDEPKPFPLQLGYGIITSCVSDIQDEIKGPVFCVWSKCSDREQVTLGGDSGSPVFVDGKIVGVLFGGDDYPAKSIYTAVSPHLTWIYNEMNKKSVITQKKNVLSRH